MKNFLIVAISLLCIICAGCGQMKFNLIITDTGEVIRKWQFLGTAPFSQQIEDIKNKNKKLFPDIKIDTVVEGDMHGYEFTVRHPDIESFARSTSELYGVHEGRNKGISRRQTWFFDEYDFDFWAENRNVNVPIGTTVNETLFSQVVYDCTINLPYAVDATNADEILDGGKVLKWDLAPMLIYGGEKSMQARFKIWHKDKVFLTAAVELMLLVATIFFLIKARSTDSETLGKDFRFKRNVFAGLFVALTLIAAYLLFTPVAFTDADIISVAM